MLGSNGSSQEKRGTRLQSTFPPFMAANKVKPLVKTQSKNTLKWGGAFNNEDLQAQIKREEQRKQRKHAEMLLRTWETLQAQEREEKHLRLKEKVTIQRQLIQKADKQYDQWKEMQLEKQYKKREKQRQDRKLVSATLQAHGTQHAFHKDKLIVLDEGRNVQSTDDFEKDKTNDNFQHIEENVESQTTTNEIDVLDQFANPENKILKYLGIEQNFQEQVKIEDMWFYLKAHSDRELHPLQVHLYKLKKRSSPSVKECLQLYEQPTPRDHYTGKPILLSSALSGLRRITPPSRKYTLKLNRSSASLKSRCSQKMLEKISLNTKDNNDDWFTGLEVKQRSRSAPECLCKQLKTQSVRSKTSTTSTFKTDKKLRTIEKEPFVEINRKTCTKAPTCLVMDIEVPQQESNWLPLTMNALKEYKGVKERITSGHGKFRNGRVILWKRTQT